MRGVYKLIRTPLLYGSPLYLYYCGLAHCLEVKLPIFVKIVLILV
jgi:hypothetical protein